METSAALELARHTLLLFGIILAVGTFFGLVAKLLRVPDVVVFLLVGMLLGPEVTGLVNVRADSALNQLILIFGSCYILFDGGASLRLKVLKEVWITIVVIATLGVLITAAITGMAAYSCSACRRSWRCCSARSSPLPTRPRWCRSSSKSASRTAWRRP